MLIGHLRSNAVAYLALCVALGGTSYAAIQLPKNSVGTKQIKKNAVKSKKVKNGSLKAADFAAGQLPAGQKGDKGDPGVQGAQGIQGIQGVQGPAGPTFGAVKGGVLSDDPPADPDADASGSQSFGFTLPNAGPVLLRRYVPSFHMGCTSGSGRAGLYVDGNPVPDTSIHLDDTNTGRGPEWLAIVELEAGPHIAAVIHDCPNGALDGQSIDIRGTWTALLLGDA